MNKFKLLEDSFFGDLCDGREINMNKFAFLEIEDKDTEGIL